jgi:iron complex transport system substrate-binding protein
MFPPDRIICLTEETVETLYLLGEHDCIVGISGYVVRPPQARREKPRVSAFTSANIDKILALKPDLVLTFSDLQADIVADLIRCGLNVHAFNQRTVAGIFDMIRMLGAMVDAGGRAEELVATLEAGLVQARGRAECLPRRPRVFFEEWDDPLISGIGWVSELIEIAGGIDIFADRKNQGAAKNRIVRMEEVVERAPRSDHRLMVRQEVPARARCGAAWVCANPSCAASTRLRDKVIADLAARPCRVDRWPRGAPED